MIEKPKGSLISYMANRVKSEGGINMAQGIPAFQPPKELLDKLHNVVYEPIHQYAPGTGNKLLVDQLLKKYQEFKIKAQNLLVVNGGTEALSLVYTYFAKKLNNPFTTLAFDPVYESYKNLPRIFNQQFVSFSLNNNTSIDFNHLEKTIINENVRVVFISSPGNPLGKVMTAQEIKQIIKLAEKHNFYVVFDSVYCELYYQEPPYSPLNHLSPNVFYVNAFSKKLSITGWRIGYLITHESHMADIRDIHDYTGLSTPSILQQAAAEYLRDNNFGDDYASDLRLKLKNNYQILSRALNALGFKIIEAEGGYFIWAELPKKYTDGLEFALHLYETEKVAVVPGLHFSENAKNILRFNIAINDDEIKEAILRLKRFIQD